jgi:nucleoside-diphosphate-sugar epimerase
LAAEEFMRKVVITGAAGFIGSHLTERLLAEETAVVGIDDLSHGSLANIAGPLMHPQFTFHQMDCSNSRALKGVAAGCDAIVHLAALKIPRYGNALATLEQNIAGMHAAANVALALDADLVVASTSDVYGNAEAPFREDGNLVLGAPTSRRWAYAVSKLYDEHMCLALAEEQGLRVTILRLFGSYGPRNHPSWWGGPQSAFIEALLNEQTMEIHGDGQQVRTFTFVHDTVDGFVRALRRVDSRGEIINIGGSLPTRIIDLAEAVQRAL